MKKDETVPYRCWGLVSRKGNISNRKRAKNMPAQHLEPPYSSKELLKITKYKFKIETKKIKVPRSKTYEETKGRGENGTQKEEK